MIFQQLQVLFQKLYRRSASDRKHRWQAQDGIWQIGLQQQAANTGQQTQVRFVKNVN